ncbi:MAG: hypothetical protein ACI93R_000931 [Flavobacteriales bacterium]|jgi:hypothetical protein
MKVIPNIVIFKIAETLPLVVFLILIRNLENPKEASSWFIPYFICSLLSIASSTLLISTKTIINRCFIGIYSYFYLGLIAQLLNLDKFNQILGQLEAAAMMLCIAIAGLLYTIVSRHGFVGVKNGRTPLAISYSGLLTAAAFLATGISYISQGNVILSDFVPFIGIFGAMGIAQNALSKQKKIH